MTIIIDNDPKMGHEINNPARRFFNIFFVPFLSILPSSLILKFVKGSHKSVNEVVENATTHAALEVLYKKGHKKHSKNFIQKFFHKVWFDMSNSKAVRNRLRIVKRELTDLINKSASANNGTVSILSIASGSARAVIESIYDVNKINKINVSTVFLDKNPSALEYSKNLLKETDLDSNSESKYSWVNGTAGTFLNDSVDESYNIIEMVGLLDYFNAQKAVSIFSGVKRVLKKDGAFVTANVCPNSEEKFMTKVLKWEMIYRTAEELEELLVQAGFEKNKIALYYEPLKVHVVAVAVK